LQQLMQKVL